MEDEENLSHGEKSAGLPRETAKTLLLESLKTGPSTGKSSVGNKPSPMGGKWRSWMTSHLSHLQFLWFQELAEATAYTAQDR